MEPTRQANQPINAISAPMIETMSALIDALCAARDSNPGPAD
jgi:hypothetical protein